MSETLSQLTAGTSSALSDIIPVTQGSTGPSTGTTRKLTTGQLLASGGAIYAGDPADGVKADSATNDTAAWAAALAAAATRGAWVVAPLGVSLANITIPSNVGIIGFSTESYSVSLGSTTLGSVILSTSVSLPAITMSQFSRLKDIQVSGVSSQPCIDAHLGYADIDGVDCFGGSDGIRFATAGAGSSIHRALIHECVRGIANPNGVRILGGNINLCGTGIVLGNGCNHNRITGTTIEWSTGTNLSIDGTGGAASDNTIAGCVFDAAGGNSVLLRAARNTTISGCGMPRAGRAQGGSPGNSNDASIYMQNCTGVVVSGSVGGVGRSDDGSGYLGPYYAVYDGVGNVNCLIATNILPYHNNSGSATAGPINSTSTFNLAASLNVAFWSA